MHNNIAGSDPIISANRARSKRHDHSDEALIEKVAAGNRLAMQVLFARHHARVYRFILRFIGDHALAEDLASEVFLTVWRQAHQLRGTLHGLDLAAGVSPATRRSAELRRRRDAPSRSTRAALAIERSGATIRKSHLQAKDRSKILRQCLGAAFARNTGTMIDLVYYHEKSIQEVAEIVGIPGNTVKTRTFYAREDSLSELLRRQRGVAGATALMLTMDRTRSPRRRASPSLSGAQHGDACRVRA